LNQSLDLEQTNKNVSFEKNSKSLVLKIGSRKSNNYSRIYETENSLRFEHEMKGRFFQKYHFLLFSNRLEEFEQKLSSHSLLYFGKLLPLNFSYLNWLVIRFRPIRKQPILQLGLNSDSIKSEISVDAKTLVMLLQFLTYAQHLDSELEYLGGIPSSQVFFKLRDFLEFQNPMVKFKKSNAFE
jgi:hypothetical protein